MKKLLVGFQALSLITLLFACKGEPKQVSAVEGTNVITAEGKKEAIPGAGAADATTFYIISQSTKSTANAADRATKFANFVKGIDITKICYTNGNEAEMATANAVNTAKGCPTEGFTIGAVEPFTISNLDEQKGKSIAVVTHGELTSKILTLLSAKDEYKNITDDGADHLFVVSAKGKGAVVISEYKL
jgi:hypothetical protein